MSQTVDYTVRSLKNEATVESNDVLNFTRP